MHLSSHPSLTYRQLIWQVPSPPLSLQHLWNSRLGADQAPGQEGPDGADDGQTAGEHHDGEGKDGLAGGELVAKELEVEGQGESVFVAST